MLHPHFMDILRGIYKRDMFVGEINTNLSFVTQAMLDEMGNTVYVIRKKNRRL